MSGPRGRQTADDVIRSMQVPAGLVDQPCSEEHLRELSRHVHDWESIIGSLEFAESVRVVEAKIWRLHPRGLQQQTTEMFLEWRQSNGRRATYKKLIEVLVRLQKIVLAEKVCEILHPVAPRDGMRGGVVEPNDHPSDGMRGGDVQPNDHPSEGMRGGDVEPMDQSTGEDEPDDPAPRDGLEEGEVNPTDQLPREGQPDLPAAPRGGLNDKEEEVKPKDQPIGKGDLDKVEILLVVFTKPEKVAAMEKLEEPSGVTLLPADNDITLGWFGGYRVALLCAGMGDRCERPVRETLKALKNVDKVIALGIAFGAYRGEQELGDVLVSRTIEYGDVKHASVTGARGPRMETDSKLDNIFCRSLDDWSGKVFLCDHEGSRYSVVHVGLIVSSNNLWNNPDQKSKLQEAYKNQTFIGGEMEGGFICKAAKEVEEKGQRRGHNGKIAVIVIKGVSDYGDGKKAASKGWQPIAARGAASYAAYKLQKHNAATKHADLSAGGSTAVVRDHLVMAGVPSGSKSSPDGKPQPMYAQARAAHRQTSPRLPPQRSQDTAHPRFTVRQDSARPGCQMPGCSRNAWIDLNTGDEYPVCSGHVQDYLVHGITNTHISAGTLVDFSPPPVPPDQQCKLPGCTRVRYAEPGGRVHEFCGRTHARQFSGLAVGPVPPAMKCSSPGCPRQKRQKDDGSGYFDFCSISCRNSGRSGLEPSASTPQLGTTPENTCILPTCNNRRYTDPANGRVLDYCCRSHAFEARQQAKGIVTVTDTVAITVLSGQEFQRVSAIFTRTWATGKGPCPTLSFILKVKNTKLRQRWTAYLSQKGMEEHYHGTTLTCNITAMQILCTDQDCGICEICSNGLDRRSFART